MQNFIALSGLPRSGSTLLSSILSQNPNIHAEGNSALCQLMWDIQISIVGNSMEQLRASNRGQNAVDILKAIPGLYYKDINKPIVIDKCRSWTLPSNMETLKRYITPNPKVIVLERPIIDIVKSFVNLRKENNWEGDAEQGLLDEMSEPIMRSLDGVKWAKENNQFNNFIFIQYDDLINNTKETINKIYKFCEIEPFEHNFNNIVNQHPEDDTVYNMIGQHDVRPTISKRQLNIELTQDTIDKCNQIQKSLL
jgi:sulfotransferase